MNVVHTSAAWIVAVVALGATTATSCSAVKPLTYLWLASPTTIAFRTVDSSDRTATLSSTDAGAHWSPTDIGRLDGWGASALASTTTATCVPAALQHCFKVKGDQVLESTDGGHIWAVTWKRPPTMPRKSDTTCGGGGQLNAPKQILIMGTGVSAVIVVGVGTDGVLRRSVGAATWQVVNVLSSAPST